MDNGTPSEQEDFDQLYSLAQRSIRERDEAERARQMLIRELRQALGRLEDIQQGHGILSRHTIEHIKSVLAAEEARHAG